MADLYVPTAGEPIPVKANLLTHDNAAAVALWCHGRLVTEHDALNHSQTYPAINVPTAQGMKRAQLGSYIVRFASGEFEVMNPHVFVTLYIPYVESDHA